MISGSRYLLREYPDSNHAPDTIVVLIAKMVIRKKGLSSGAMRRPVGLKIRAIEAMPATNNPMPERIRIKDGPFLFNHIAPSCLSLPIIVSMKIVFIGMCDHAYLNFYKPYSACFSAGILEIMTSTTLVRSG